MDDIQNFTTLSSPNGPGQAFVALDGAILDVTAYLEAATNVIEVSAGVYSRAFALDRMFLPLDVTKYLFINLGEDITEYFEGNVSNAQVYKDCLLELFHKGITPDKAPTGCSRINPALWATMGAGLLYFLLKMNLAHLCRMRFMQRLLFSSAPELSSAPNRSCPYTIMMVPCYSEPSETLKQSFESLARSIYEDSRKLLLFVCDGVTRSKYDSKETYLCLLEALGYSGTEDPTPQPYISLGQNRRRINYAKVFAGYYETGRNRVPYLVVVKIGNPKEISLGCVPGNRGKRDSMVLIFGFLERCLNLANNRMTPLEYELFNQCYSVLGIDPRKFKYMMVTDADLQVQGDVVQTLVSRLEKDRKMLAISGHVRPANPEQNITTMLQIFPLYLTFYSGLAYEAFLGTVLSINGGFMMYKLWTENVPALDEKRPPTRSFWSRRSKSLSTSQQTIQSKWPKVSDEIVPGQDTWGDSVFSNNSDNRPDSMATDKESRLSLAPCPGIRPCCIHPTVLRNFANARADTMHMKNVLLLGEEQYLGIVLLRSHPQHRLGFEPEAIGYATLPTNIFTLQALQSRNLRAAFHNQIEVQRAAWDLGLGCWIVSFTKLLDMIFSMPIIVYLYGVYFRLFIYGDLAYGIIAVSFASLVALHILYFIVRRQFKYVIWFILYCLCSVPLFAVWFPLVAIWCSDYAERWYDVWPAADGHRGRIHGAVDTEDDSHPQQKDGDSTSGESKVENEEELVPRMRLGEFEAVEAERAYQRAVEEAAALDSNFTGFTGFVSGRASIHSVGSRLSGSFGEQILSTPPVAQLRGGQQQSLRVRSTATSGYKLTAAVMGMYGTTMRPMDGQRKSPQRANGKDDMELLPTASPTSSIRSGSFANPFVSSLDNPFDDGYAVPSVQGGDLKMQNRRSRSQFAGKHKQSHSQSSYFTYSSRNTGEDYPTAFYPSRNDVTTTASGFTRLPPSNDILVRGRSYSTESAIPSDRASIRSNLSAAYSLASSSLSMDPEAALESTRYGGYNATPSGSAADGIEGVTEEGRSAALHGKVGLTIPGVRNAALAAAAAPAPPPSLSRIRSTGGGGRRRPPPPPPPAAVPPAAAPTHRRDRSDASSSRRTGGDAKQSIRQEIQSYLLNADLDAVTRAQVKQHLYRLFGDSVEHDDDLEEFINNCIEEITLELLSKSTTSAEA